MKFAITGVTRSGNMGGAAMLQTAIDELSARFPGSEFLLLSLTPQRDRQYGLDSRVVVISAKPLLLMSVYFPLALLMWPVRRLGITKSILRTIPYFAALYDADIVIDLCGIAFVDGRGLALLAYNAACCVPALVTGTRIAKLSQALGPFNTTLNRIIANFILFQCQIVVARGATSLDHLKSIGIDTAVSLPDVSFALTLHPRDRDQAQEIIRAPLNSRLLIISPSEVINRLCARKGIGFVQEVAQFIRLRIDDGWHVLLVPHSLAKGTSKNNDVDLCRAIAALLPDRPEIALSLSEDPRLLRAVIGQADLFVGCRFHSVVAALAMGVPALVVGWSHKYREMVAMLQSGDWVLDWATFSAAAADAVFKRLAEQRDTVRKEILENLPHVRRRAASNFDLVEAVLRDV